MLSAIRIMPLFPIIFLIILTSGCKVNDPEKLKPDGSLIIKAEGVSSTEVWIRIKDESSAPKDVISLQRDGQAVLLFSLKGKDTLICEDSLSPGRQYTYKVARVTSKDAYTSEELSIRTMDTTSHDFHFRTFWVCNRSSSLRDVAIINENDIWAVGDMYMNLPEGKEDYEPVGAVHWDGKEWKQIKLPAVASPTYNTFLTPNDILAFSPNDIWFANGGVIHFDGKKVTKCYWIADFPGNVDNPVLGKGKGITRLWGTSSNSIYAAGYKGAIAHFDGKTWKKIDCNTDLTIQDIWGSKDPLTGEEVVLCVASRLYSGDLPKVLRIKNDKVTELSIDGLPPSLCSVWFMDLNKVYITGDGHFVKNLNIGTEKWDFFSRSFTRYWSDAVRGNDLNDIVLAGAFGDICHFNGKTWKTYLGNGTEYINGSLNGVDINGNTICAVGTTGSSSVIVLGQR
ncbi:MAG: hypothetical protein HF308_20115, partial [Ignavibacteria bacterium]|nr:hypothetical protein [Ignavibacteria bacterium]